MDFAWGVSLQLAMMTAEAIVVKEERRALLYRSQIRHPYLLRNVTAAHPNHIWGIDVTYIPLKAGWLHLVAVLDWFSRFIVSWQLSQTLALDFVLAAAVPHIWNSDQGSRFTSLQYLDRLLAAQVQISMDGRGRARDNIFTERLWRTIKYEEVYLHEYSNPKEAYRGLSQYITFYNYERPHQALDYQPPVHLW